MGAFNLHRKFERLHISRNHLSSANSFVKSEIHTFSGLGKRTFRELERWDVEDENASAATFYKTGNKSINESDDRMNNNETVSNFEEDQNNLNTFKFNRGLLCKASASVDLISQKIEFKNLMNQSVSGKFVTIILELTHDFINKLEEQEKQIIQHEVQLCYSSTGESPDNLNIKFVKPSPHFYNKIMCLWFKFSHLFNGDENNNVGNIQEMLLP